ncbi:Alcohol dehydrogenase zinc-binding domain protein [Thiorhodococcus drewsii AZ1]|uniref:Alcohol dehydrogenase zinc-binding domain protein n=1 Tax=Thiorhodococcus drewsii AZ1 TaxID=765913 RepID=G2E2T6_9GAMM|nr:zinc-binding alcohol dehydrogenase [Thiorhodococcus drewsii]EGV30640.1 Alcohol dehydrogenase zinc-binding domain protein [Thiorhodococcus drewsii AZ1]
MSMPGEDGRTTAFWVCAPGQGELRDEPLPPLPEGHVRVRTLYSGISRGTESLVYRGEVPESEHQRMRAPFQVGEFPGPVKYGYCNVGLVEAGPDTLMGSSVFCLHPHQTLYQVPAEWVHPLPDGLPPERAVLAANMETAVNGLWDATPKVGDRVAVIGAGVLGCLCVWLASRIPGCEVELIDIDPQRAVIAAKLGVVFREPDQASPDADLVIHASGAPAGVSTALDLAGFESRVIELSWFGTRTVPLALGQGFHQRRLRLISSQVGSVADVQRARWDHRRRMGLALRLLRDPLLDCLVSGESPFSELPEVQARLAQNPPGVLMHRIRYPGHSRGSGDG